LCAKPAIKAKQSETVENYSFYLQTITGLWGETKRCRSFTDIIYYIFEGEH
jgi:hypothetical protein